MEGKIRLSPGVYLDEVSNEIHFQLNNEVKKSRVEPVVSEILKLLATSKGTVNREEMIAQIWDGNEGVGKTAITRNIYKIRKLFEDQGFSNPVETLPKIGYRLKSPIEGRTKKTSLKKGISIGLLVIISLLLIKLLFPGIWTMMIHFFEHRLTH